MSSLDPLKSVMSIGGLDDTSLAVPSGHQCSSGKQRVLEQVQTLRRTKSRNSSSNSSNRSGSFSPTSPSFEPVFVDPAGFLSSSSNGSGFFGNGLSKTLPLDRNRKPPDSPVRRNPSTSAYQYEKRSYTTLGTMAVNQSSRSEHDVAWRRSAAHRSSAPQQRFPDSGRKERPASQSARQTGFASNGTFQTRTTKQMGSSQPDGPWTPGATPTGIKEHSGSNGSAGVVDITMKDAVVCLSSPDETHQHCGASYIQHNTFIDDRTKEEVLRLNGIPPLVALLHSRSSQVSQAAAAALRNLSFKSDSSKEAIHRRGGVAEAVALLRDTESVELQRQLTGLLWNLSSADELKPDLLKSALPVLMERVILPHTTGPAHQDAEVFYHATGCLRNLSSGKQNNRQVMRKCRGLVDSLVGYVGESVEAGETDDKSVENCVCVLHNLTFQLEDEAATLFSRIKTLSRSVHRSDSEDAGSPIGCFSPQSRSPQREPLLELPAALEEPRPSGAGWLFHSRTLKSYLELLGSSQRADTQEACCGALHNLTAQDGVVSRLMTHTIVQKLRGLQVICPLLKSDRANLQRSAVALLGNLTNTPGLTSAIAARALPELRDVIVAGAKGTNECDDTLSMACRAASSLITKEPAIGKQLLNRTLVHSLTGLSQNGHLPKTSRAASLFLYRLWSDRDLQSFLKKEKMAKPTFVNDVTTSALKSLQNR